ncbi:MAG TPA: transcriptional regulator [Bdellovibrionota bacterium]
MKPADLLKSANALLMDRVRLGIMAALAAAEEPLDFNNLLESLELSKGNLSAHAAKLEEGGLIEVKKEFVGKRPRTTYKCTDMGRNELRVYLTQVESLLKLAQKG